MKIFTTTAALFLLILHLILIIGAMGYLKRLMQIFRMPYDHIFWGFIAMLLMAIAISSFRILQDVETRGVQYLHAILHVIICCVMFHSLYILEDPEWHYMHGSPAFMVYYCYLVQVIGAFILFCALPDGNVRDFVSSLHSVIGVWLYHCYVGVAISGVHSCRNYYDGVYKYETEDSGLEVSGCIRLLDYYKSLIILAAFLLNFLVVFPFFQWEMIRPS